jgi:hypothetical protein
MLRYKAGMISIKQQIVDSGINIKYGADIIKASEALSLFLTNQEIKMVAMARNYSYPSTSIDTPNHQMLAFYTISKLVFKSFIYHFTILNHHSTIFKLITA